MGTITFILHQEPRTSKLLLWGVLSLFGFLFNKKSHTNFLFPWEKVIQLNQRPPIFVGQGMLEPVMIPKTGMGQAYTKKLSIPLIFTSCDLEQALHL